MLPGPMVTNESSRRSRRNLQSVIALSMFLCGFACDRGASPEHPSPPVSGAPLQISESELEPEVWHEEAPTVTKAPELGPSALVEHDEAPSQQGTPPLQVVLEVEPGFLDRPLPAANSKRYGRWREKGRIKVGKSHLDVAMTSPDERFLIVRSQAEGTVRIYARKSRKLVGNYKVAGFSSGAFERGTVTRWPGTEHGDAFLVGNTRGLRLYSMLDGRQLEVLDKAPVWDMHWSADGRTLVAKLSVIASQTSTLTFFHRTDRGGLDLIKRVEMPERVDELALSRDSSLMAIVNYPSDTVELIDLRTGETRWREGTPDYTSSVDISPDGTRVAVGGAKVVLYDLTNPKQRSSYAKFGNNVDQVRFSPSGDALAASAYDGHLRILSATVTGKSLALRKDLRHSGSANVYAVTFLADGSGLMSSSGDKTVRIWGK
jgi:WD40 repeat protein